MRILLLVLLLCSPLRANEIVAHLSARETLTPVSISPIQAQGAFDPKYVEGLEKVLRFDFENNGKTELALPKNAVYKIVCTLREKNLRVRLSSESVAKEIEAPITADLAQDRQIVHRIHDTLFQSLFHTQGVAATRILYTVRTRKSDNSAQWISDVWQADYDGSNARQVTHDNSLCVTPTFVPAKENERSRNFLYVSYKVGQPKIFASEMHTHVGQRLTYLKGNQLMPTIAPTLDKIAFICDITGNPDLFVQDFSPESGVIGKPQQVFCAPGATQGTPTFSPDGKQLAFVSNKDGTPRIYILTIPEPGASIKNLKPRMISKKTRENTCPNWSPDGQKIAYSASSSGTRQIWIYDTVSGEERQLTEGPGNKENPTWAPNSLQLMFDASTPTSSELYMIGLNQKKAVKITSGPGEKRFPAWEVAWNKGNKI